MEYAKSNKVSPISLNQPISNSEDSITWEEQLDDGNINTSEKLILKELVEFLREIVNDEFDSSKEEIKVLSSGVHWSYHLIMIQSKNLQIEGNLLFMIV